MRELAGTYASAELGRRVRLISPCTFALAVFALAEFGRGDGSILDLPCAVVVVVASWTTPAEWTAVFAVEADCESHVLCRVLSVRIFQWSS